jgi:signal transduction histidine kinase
MTTMTTTLTPPASRLSAALSAARRVAAAPMRAPAQRQSRLAAELRDGLLQDLLAAGMLVTAARRALPDGPDAAGVGTLLEQSARTLDADVERVRALIDRLGPIRADD